MLDEMFVIYSCSVISGYANVGCNFDYTGICNWKQSTTDTFDWSINNGTTPSQGTGPRADHTQNQGKNTGLF
jgi:hypothetical protein